MNRLEEAWDCFRCPEPDKIQSKQITNARGMPGIIQVECIPRLSPGPGLGLKLWSLGLGLLGESWAQAAARKPGHMPDLHDARHASDILGF